MEFKTKKTGIKPDYTTDTRKYFGQQCQDDDINKKFRELHKKIIDEIISFCKENNIKRNSIILKF